MTAEQRAQHGLGDDSSGQKQGILRKRMTKDSPGCCISCMHRAKNAAAIRSGNAERLGVWERADQRQAIQRMHCLRIAVMTSCPVWQKAVQGLLKGSQTGLLRWHSQPSGVP